MAVGFYLMRSKHFRKHPYPLLALACIFESGFTFNWSQKYAIVVFKLHKIFLLSQWQNAGDLSNYEEIYASLKLLLISWKVCFATLLIMNIVTNGLIYIDLYLTLKNPFYPRARRAKKYFMILFCVFISSISVAIFAYKNNTISLNVYDKLWPLSIYMKSIVIGFVISTVYVITLIIWRLCKPGTSRTLRNKVIKRYIVYLVIYLSWHLQFLLFKAFDTSILKF